MIKNSTYDNDELIKKKNEKKNINDIISNYARITLCHIKIKKYRIYSVMMRVVMLPV